jgi:hypothetical protein
MSLQLNQLTWLAKFKSARFQGHRGKIIKGVSGRRALLGDKLITLVDADDAAERPGCMRQRLLNDGQRDPKLGHV